MNTGGSFVVLDMGDSLEYYQRVLMSFNIPQHALRQITEESLRQIFDIMEHDFTLFSNQLMSLPKFQLFMHQRVFEYNPHAKITLATEFKRLALSIYFNCLNNRMFEYGITSEQTFPYMFDHHGSDYVSLLRFKDYV